MWASAIGVCNESVDLKQHEEMLLNAATFLAHLRAGAVEVRGELPERKVRPWDCALDHDRSGLYIGCPDLELRASGEVPKTAVEAALAELRSRARAAGAVVLSSGFVTGPAPPSIVKFARDMVNVVRAEINYVNSDAIMIKNLVEKLNINMNLTNIAALAAIETGNWIALVKLRYTNNPPDNMDFWTYFGSVAVRVRYNETREALVKICPARAPRALRGAFAAAYAKWRSRIAAALLEAALEEAGV
ncbi:MAG: hypothetical protein RXS42_07535 [Nitrososphaeria archaeon]